MKIDPGVVAIGWRTPAARCLCPQLTAITRRRRTVLQTIFEVGGERVAGDIVAGNHPDILNVDDSSGAILFYDYRESVDQEAVGKVCPRNSELVGGHLWREALDKVGWIGADGRIRTDVQDALQ